MLAASPSYAWEHAKRGLTALIKDSVARNTALLALNSLLNGAGGVLFWFVASRLYSPAAVGVTIAGTSMVILLAGFSQLGLGIGMIRYAAAMGPTRVRRIRGVFAVVLLTASAAGVIFWQLQPTVAAKLSPAFQSPVDVAYFVAACVGWALSLQYDNYLMGRKLMGIVVLRNAVTAISRLILIVALRHLSVGALVSVTGISGIAGVLGVLPLTLARPLPTTFQSSRAVSLRVLATYSLWNHVSSVVGTLPALITPILIVSVVGGAKAAAYYMAWTLFSVLLLLPSALSWALLAERSSDRTIERGSEGFSHGQSSRLMLGITVFFIPLSILVLFALGPSYVSHGWSVMVVLAFGIWPYHRIQLLMTEMRLGGSQRMLALAYSSSQLLSVILTVPLLLLLDTVGAALAWAVGQGVLFVWLWLCTRKGSI